ncbi:hypothetical protein A2716_03480 [candidate division WWE3 bacterium RIFCSPHIGHO2_01_FULL_40_23]|uniref:OmpR/PhoB-type domain-containing protein n=1 Tax=candidate division WWE3 bacterium RIFCSPLOWO2_01_FULL_41_18 TaxID=1802625 RepID=A0A1F4VCF7_UNCKA|nr:MAG: hypothetical protein A2716_03480 [candidate division WWE3 bacterium RIFCSPHIGHO2_01_FULL_40_23]OGC54941.1 MAG: hypothetical protein A3A78_03090 [candidate division WWE3 bacterium RIFCSPLOWO2_01_FULL_41_18]
MYKHWESQKRKILDLIANGQCASCQVCYGTNYPIFFRNLHSDLLLKRQVIPVYVDLNHLSIATLPALYALMLTSIRRTLVEKKLSSKSDGQFQGDEEFTSLIKDLIDELTQKKLKVVFFFEDADILLALGKEPYLFFESLNISFPGCVFIYTVRMNISHPANTPFFAKSSHVYENIIYMNVRDERGLRQVESAISAKIFEVMYGLTGGVDRFYGIASDLKNNLPPKKRRNLSEILCENWHLKREVKKLWESLSASEVLVLAKIVWGCKKVEESYAKDLLHLINLGLLKGGRNGYKFTVGLLKHIGMEKSVEYVTKVEITKDGVLINGTKSPLRLSLVEKKILKQFLSNKGKIVNRNVLAKSIWNGLNKKKYNEGVIDNTVLKLKSKLTGYWVNPNNLIPVEGKGFLYRDISTPK